MAKEGSVAPKERINITFKPATGGAQEEIELPLGVLGRLGWPMVRPFFLAGIRHSLRKFAKYVESQRQ